MKRELASRVAEIHLILVNDGTVLLGRLVMDDGYQRRGQREKAADLWHLPPLGPVEEMVSNERPFDSWFSLFKSRVRSAATVLKCLTLGIPQASQRPRTLSVSRRS